MTSDEMRERAYVIASVSDMNADAVMKLMDFVLETAAKVAEDAGVVHAKSTDKYAVAYAGDAAFDIADAIRALKPVQS